VRIREVPGRRGRAKVLSTMLASIFYLLFSAPGSLLTCCRCLGSHVASLVTSQESLCLDLGCRSTGKFLVEAHNPLHAHSVLRSPDALFSVSISPLLMSLSFNIMSAMVGRQCPTVLLSRRNQGRVNWHRYVLGEELRQWHVQWERQSVKND
jgi:hypothetical protein